MHCERAAQSQRRREDGWAENEDSVNKPMHKCFCVGGGGWVESGTAPFAQGSQRHQHMPCHCHGAGEEKWSIRAKWKWGFLKQHILLMFWFLNHGNRLPLRKQQAINSKANRGCHFPQPWRLTATPVLSPATAVDLHLAVCITALRGESRPRGHRLRLQLRKWNSCFWERWGRCFQLMDTWSVTLFPMNIAGVRTCGMMCVHRNQTQGPAHRGSLGIPFYVRLCTRKNSGFLSSLHQMPACHDSPRLSTWWGTDTNKNYRLISPLWHLKFLSACS